MAEALRLASAVLGIEMGAEDRTDGYPTDVAAADNARVAPAAARYAATASKAAAAAEASVQARQRELMQRMGILDGENDLAAVLTAYDDARASVAAAERQPQQPPPPQQQRVAPVVDQQQAEQRAALRQQQRAATLMEPEEDAYSSAPAFEPAPPAEPMDRNPPQSSRVHVNRSGSVFIDGGAEYSAPAPELKVAMQPVPARAAAATAAATQQQPQEQAAATTVSVAHAMIVDGLRSDNELLRSMLGQLQKETAQRVTGLQEELRTVTAEKERYRSALIRAGIPTGVQQPSAEHGAAQSAPRHSYAPSVAGDRLDAAVARLLAALGEHCLVKMALTRRPGQLVATHPAVYDADAPLSISFAHDGVTLLAERDAARGGGTVALRDYLAALYAPFTLPSGAAPAAAFAASAGSSSSSSSSSSGRSGGSPGAVAAAMFARARTPVDFGLTPDFASVKQTVIKPPSQSFPQQLPPQLPPQSQAQQEPQSRVRINRHGSISIGALNGGAGGGAGAGVSSSPPSPQPAFGSLLAHLSAHKPASGLGGGNGSGRPLPRSSLFQALQAEEAMLLEEEETPPQGGVRRRGTYFGSTTTPASPAQQVREFKSSERRRVQQQQRMPMPEGSYRASPIASPPPSMPFGESPSAGAGGARTVVQMRRSMPRQGGAAAEQSPPPPMPSSQTQPPPPAGRPPTGGGRRGRQRGTPGRKAGQGYAAAPPSSSSLPPPPPGRPPAYSASGSRSSKKVAHGSSFTVALPFRAVAAVEAEPPAAPRSSKGGGKGSASVGYKGKMRAARLTPSQKQAEKLRKRALGRKPRGRQGRGRYRN